MQLCLARFIKGTQKQTNSTNPTLLYQSIFIELIKSTFRNCSGAEFNSDRQQWTLTLVFVTANRHFSCKCKMSSCVALLVGCTLKMLSKRWQSFHRESLPQTPEQEANCRRMIPQSSKAEPPMDVIATQQIS